MHCSELDWKAYSLGEATAAERKAMEAHASGCAPCRTELESLQLVRAALLTVADEEPPRRIAFVSDKIFEPRWYQRLNWFQLLAPTALAAAAAFAIVQTQAAPAAPQVSSAEVADRVEQAVAQRLEVAVKQALAESDARAEARTAELVKATERRLRAEHEREMNQTMAVVEANFDLMRKREARYMRASTDLGVR